jgi:NAD dependent epimerase/dehydratase family enzyme
LKKNGELPECDAVINIAGENVANPMRRLHFVTCAA